MDRTIGWLAGIALGPSLGKKILSILVPAARVSSCVFGGQHLDELYFTTAKVGLDEKQLAEQPSAGGLF